MNKLLNSVFAALCMGVGFWALPCRGEETFLLSGPGEANLGETKKAEANVKIVYGRGTGETKEAAEKDACRNAIEFAVGTFIDSETLMKNDQLIKDEILAHSNGYIEKYEVTGASRSTKGLGVEVDVKAWVKIQEAKKKVRDLVPGDTKAAEGLDGILGTSGASGSRAARDKSAAALLKKELDGFDPVRQLVNISLVSQKPTVLTEEEVKKCYRSEKLAEGEVYLRYYCQFYVMQDVYFKRFMPRFTQILEQISVHKPTVFRPTAKRVGDWWDESSGANRAWLASMGMKDQNPSTLVNGTGLERDQVGYIGRCGDDRIQPYFKNCFLLTGFRKPLKDVLANLRKETSSTTPTYGRRTSKFGRVDVVTKCNPSMTLVRGKSYFLAPAANDALSQWMLKYFFAGTTYDEMKSAGAVDYLLRLLDADGEEVAVKKVSIPASSIFLSKIEQRGMLEGGYAVDDLSSSFVWGPWLHVAGLTGNLIDMEKPCVHMSKIFPIDIRLSVEDAKLVKKVSVSLAEAVE